MLSFSATVVTFCRSMYIIITYYNCKYTKLTFNDLKVVESTDDQHYDLGDYPNNANRQYPPGHNSISIPVFSSWGVIRGIREDT